MIACMPSRYEVTQLAVTGKWSTSKLNEVLWVFSSSYKQFHVTRAKFFFFNVQAMQLCLDASTKLGEIMRSCLKEAASATQD